MAFRQSRTRLIVKYHMVMSSRSRATIEIVSATRRFPALAIASLVVSVNLVADGIREVYER